MKWSCGLSHDKIAKALGLSKGVVTKYAQLAVAAGLDWERVSALDETELQLLLIPSVKRIQVADGDYNYVESGLNLVHTEKRTETLGEKKHALLINPDMPNAHLGSVADFKRHENCNYNESMVRCQVPAGNYFMMGDNRDNSSDSRYWGFVPDNQIVGKAFLVWMNFAELKRIGQSI